MAKLTEVGCSWGGTILNLELCSRIPGMAEIQLRLQADACNQGAAVEADAIGEQQLKRTQLGSSS